MIPSLAPTAPTSAPTPRADEGPVIDSDFDTFLVMLTAQLQNQDPLNPVESTDFAEQLATFSGVEQAVQTNKLLEAMLSAQSGGPLGDPSEWIGLQAPVAGPVTFDGAPVALRLPAGGEALVVRDASGTVVAREAAPPEGSTVEWAGAGLGAGRYEFWLEGTGPDGAAMEVPVPVFRRIAEVGSADGRATVVTADGFTRPADEIDALRD